MDKYQLIFNNIFLISGLIITFFIVIGSISPLRMYFRTGMKGLLFMGVGGILGGFGFLGMVIDELGGHFGEVPIVLLVLLIIAGVPMMAIGSMLLGTKESGLYEELFEKTSFKQRLTGNIPVLKFEKPLPPAMSRRTGLIFGITAITFGCLLILLHLLFKIPGFTIHFIISGTFALIIGLLLVIFSIIYLNKGKKSSE